MFILTDLVAEVPGPCLLARAGGAQLRALQRPPLLSRKLVREERAV